MTKLSIRTALLWIWGSTFVISGGVVLALMLREKWDSNVKANPKFRIQSIVQKCSSVEALSTDYLAECLGMSVDRSFTVFEYSTNVLEAMLESSPLIKTAKVVRILPSTLHIDYSLRQPVAIVQDYQNTVMDEEGIMFPLQPFRTPKLLPEITLGEQSKSRIDFALEVLSVLKRDFIQSAVLKSPARVDVSRIDAASLGHREIVVVFNVEANKELFLRLPVREWEKSLGQFFKIPHEHLHHKVVDMRLPNTAYLSSRSKVANIEK